MARIVHIVTDMGNGGAYCSNCGFDLNSGNVFASLPNQCPDCDEAFTDSETYTNSGGSDF